MSGVGEYLSCGKLWTDFFSSAFVRISNQKSFRNFLINETQFQEPLNVETFVDVIRVSQEKNDKRTTGLI